MIKMKVKFHQKCLTLVFVLMASVLNSSSSMNIENDHGELFRGLPCVKRTNQNYCGKAGNSYPLKSMEKFIDENKALLRRMYGLLQEPRTVARKRRVLTFADSTRHLFRRDVLEGTLEEMLEKIEEDEEKDSEKILAGNGTTSARARRQVEFPDIEDGNSSSDEEDVCQSKVEIVSPYWAVNSDGKVRAVLNNKEFEQAIQQEICTKSSTARCSRDCSCQQKYKWHKLLAYNPNNECSGIFMDWFVFPSCCVCRCKKNPFL